MARYARVAPLVACLLFACALADGHRWRRQADDTKKEESLEQELCKDKDAGEWFRLLAGDGDSCRDVIQCTASGIQAIRCPSGQFFDIEKQTCDWKDAVKNCKLKNKKRKVKPLLYTDEPLCQDGFWACGDSTCIARGLFCNGEKDCADGSDENSCDIDNDPNRTHKLKVTQKSSHIQTHTPTNIPDENLHSEDHTVRRARSGRNVRFPDYYRP